MESPGQSRFFDGEPLSGLGAELRARFRLEAFDAGARVIKADERIDGLRILVSGRVRVSCLLESGDSALLSVESPPSVLGAVEILSDTPAISTVEALDSIACLSLSAADFGRYGRMDTGLLLLMVADLSRKLIATSRASVAKNASVMKRLAWYLLEPGTECVPFTRKADLASFLGTSERHLNRELAFLEENGFIAGEKKRIRILRRDGLADYDPAPR